MTAAKSEADEGAPEYGVKSASQGLTLKYLSAVGTGVLVRHG